MENLHLVMLLGRKARDAADAVLPDLIAAHPEVRIIRSLHPMGAKSTVHREEQKALWANVADQIRRDRA